MPDTRHALWVELRALDHQRFERPHVRDDLIADARATGERSLIASALLVVAGARFMENRFRCFDDTMAELEAMLADDPALVDHLSPGAARLANRRALLADKSGRGVEQWHHSVDAFAAMAREPLSAAHLRAVINMLYAEFERGAVERIGQLNRILAAWPTDAADAELPRAVVAARLAGLSGDMDDAITSARAAVSYARHLAQFPRYEAQLELVSACLHADLLDEADDAMAELGAIPATTYHAGFPLLFRAELERRRGDLARANATILTLKATVDLRYAGEVRQRVAVAEAELAHRVGDDVAALATLAPVISPDTSMVAYSQAVRLGLAVARSLGDPEAELDYARRGVALARAEPRWEATLDVRARLDQAIVASMRRVTDNDGEGDLVTAKRIRHDLMSVVGSIKLQLDMPDETRASSLESVRPGVNILGEMADQLSLFSSLRSGRVVPDFAPVDVRAMLTELVGINRHEAQSRGLRIQVSAPDGPAPITVTDRRLLARVLNNVVRNAVRHTAEGGMVRVCVDAAGHERADYPTVEVSVADSGPGLSAVVRWRLTGVGEPVLSPVKGEGGVGLVIVRRIARLVDIRISVTESELGGTRVGLVVPVGAID